MPVAAGTVPVPVLVREVLEPSRLPEPADPSDVSRLLTAEARRPFDLTAAPLLRARRVAPRWSPAKRAAAIGLAPLKEQFQPEGAGSLCDVG